MIKLKKNLKKFITILMLALIICSSLPITTFAKYITDINSDSQFGIISNSLNTYGHELHYANYDNVTYMLFCAQYGATSPNGGNYAYNSDFTVQLNKNSQAYKTIAEYIYFGYTMKYGSGLPTSTEARSAACATQQFVWEYINNHITSQYGYPARNSWNASYMSSSIYANWLSNTEALYNQYHGLNVSFNEQTNTITIGDTEIYTDTNGVLASYPSFSKNINGVIFEHTQGSNDMIVTSDKNSEATTVKFSSNQYGIYRLMPNGATYNSNQMSSYLYFQFSSGAIQDLMFSNYVDPSFFSFNVKVESGKISIAKRDSETGTKVQGNATFEGAEYKVYAGEDIYNHSGTKKIYSIGDLVATRVMNKEGATEDVDKLPLGKYIVKETTNPTGYLLDKTEYEVNLKEGNQNVNIVSKDVISNELVKKMQVHIYKSGIKTNNGLTQGLQGVEFTIKLYSDVERAKNSGYSYEEIWNGIDEYGNTVDVDSKRVAEAQVIAPTYQSIVTDENGDAYSEKLPYGVYWVKETVTPKDYYTAEDFKFTISEDESEVKEIAKKVKDLYVNDEQMETYIKLVKKDKDSGKIVTLTSATFQIKATRDIYDRGNGKILYKKGEVITQKIGSTTYNSFTTNSQNLVIPEGSYNNDKEENGVVVTPLMLPVGSYEITEIQIPEGFLQIDKPVTFNIEGIRDFDKDQDGDYIKEIVVENEQPVGTLIVNKSLFLRENVDKSLINTNDLSGIQFKLTAKEDIIDKADGSIIYNKGQEVKTYNLDKTGNLKVEKLPIGLYELEEIKTIPGLILDSTKYEVKFTQKDNVTKIYGETKEIVNYTTLTEFSKTDITGKEELEGAKLSIIDENNNVIDSWTSGKETHKIEGLEAGKTYILREEITPDGYVQATDIQFKTENTKEIQEIKMIDKVVEMSKQDIAGNELEGAKMQVFDKDNELVDEWTSGKEAHKINGLTEGKTYTLHEEIAIEGYVKATDMEFVVTEDKKTQKIIMLDKIVDVIKTDLVTGEELEGAELEVIDKDGNVVDKWISTKEPHHVTGLTEGETYTLIETTCPYGFEQAESISFTVSEDKQTQVIEMKDMPILKTIKVLKRDSSTQEIIRNNNFIFGIYGDAECTKLIEEIKANKEEGTATFENLRYGVYYIKETKAPKGYQLSNRIAKVEINDKGVFVDGEPLEEQDEAYSFTYYNDLIPKVQTGNEMNYILLFSLMIISLIGIMTGVIMIRRKKQKNN